jgi:hypothetical protein
VGKSKGKRQLGRPRHRWEDNVKAYFERTCAGVDWIDLAQDIENMLASAKRNEI